MQCPVANNAGIRDVKHRIRQRIVFIFYLMSDKADVKQFLL
jgi:hypothetical protein